MACWPTFSFQLGYPAFFGALLTCAAERGLVVLVQLPPPAVQVTRIDLLGAGHGLSTSRRRTAVCSNSFVNFLRDSMFQFPLSMIFRRQLAVSIVGSTPDETVTTCSGLLSKPRQSWFSIAALCSHLCCP
jgi:hypothetical protein